MRSSLLASLLVAIPLFAQQQPVHTEAPLYVTAIELMADVRDAGGKVPQGLTAADFVVTENGVEKRIIGVDYLAAERAAGGVPRPPAALGGAPLPVPAPVDWQFVIFFDRFFSSSTGIRNAAETFASQADELVAMGTVEIVVADPHPALLFGPSRDVKALRENLRKVSNKGGKDWLVRHRRRLLGDQDMKSGTPENFARMDALTRMLPLERLKPYLHEEIAAVERSRGLLIEWISRYPRKVPRALFLVSGGFETDPVAYYSEFADGPVEAERLRQDFPSSRLGTATNSLARLLAASAWTTVSVEMPFGADQQWTEDAGRSGIGRVRGFVQNQPAGNSTVFTSMRTREPLLAFADATGGSVVNRAKIVDAVDDLSQRVRITYQVSRPPDGKAHEVVIKAKRPGVSVRTLKYASDVTPEETAGVRTVIIARDGKIAGDLPTDVSIKWGIPSGGRLTGKLTIKTQLSSILPLLRENQGLFRVTIAVLERNAQPIAIHRVVSSYDVSRGTFLYTAPIAGPDSRLDIAVTVEELSLGVWGGARALQ